MNDYVGISKNQLMEIDQNNQHCRIWTAFINNTHLTWEKASEWVPIEKKEEID